MRFIESLGKLSKRSLTFISLGLLVVIGVLDYLTGLELSFSIFYLLPISLAAWLVGRKAGVALSIIATVAWLAADLLNGHVYSSPASFYWNSLVRLGSFLVVTVTLSALQASRTRQEELGQFIVHDLRSPLSNVITGLQTLDEMADEKKDAIEKHVVEMCLISSNRMLTLINSLLDLTRLEHRQMPLSLGAVNVNDLIEQSLLQVSMWAKTRSVTLGFKSEAAVETIYADSTLTMRILVNLLSNAIKFSPPQSVVTIQTASCQSNQLVFSVSDQGPGISSEWAAKVFDKYAQVEAYQTKETMNGSGLGLSFCRQAVEAQGGHIWIETGPDQGTKIAFTLPVTDRLGQYP